MAEPLPQPATAPSQPFAAQVALPTGEVLQLRLLQATDAPSLGRYFLGLSPATRHVYAPHPFDQPTADQLCASLDPASHLRFVAWSTAGECPRVVAYIIVNRSPGTGDAERYAARGLKLSPTTTCTLAPSVADDYQSRGVGTALMAPILEWLRHHGYRQMVLQGGVRAQNARAQRFYTKLGFRCVGDFQTAGQVNNHDMILDL